MRLISDRGSHGCDRLLDVPVLAIFEGVICPAVFNSIIANPRG